MGALLKNTFTASNGTNVTSYTPDLGPTWTSNGTFTIQSNTLKNTGSDSDANAVQDAGVADVVITCDYLTPGSNWNGGIIFNYQDASNFWLADVTYFGTPITLYKKISGSYTSLGSSGSFTITNNQTYAIRIVTWNDSVDIFVNGILRFTYYTASRPLKTATGVGFRYASGGGISPALDNLNVNQTDYSLSVIPKPTFPKVITGRLAQYVKQAIPLTEGSGTTVKDFASPANNGTLSGSMAWTSGLNGYCLSGNGSSSYLSTPLQNLGYSQGTIAWWMKPALAHNDGTAHGWWSNRPLNASPLFSAQKYSDNNIYIGFTASVTDYRVVIPATIDNYTKDVWQWYAFTWMNAGASVLYRNAQTIGLQISVPTVPQNIAQNFDWGRENFTNNFNGLMDGMFILNKALSQSELADWYFDTFKMYRRHRFTFIPSGVKSASASNTITFSQSVVADLHRINEHLAQTLTFTQSARGFNGRKFVSNTITFAELAHASKVYHRTLADTITYHQSASANRIHTAHNTFTISQSATAQKYKGTQNSLVISESLSRIYKHSERLFQLFVINQSASPIRKLNRALTSTVSFVGAVHVTHVRFRTLHNTIVFQNFCSTAKIGRPSNHLTLTQSVQVKHVIVRRFYDQLVMSQTLSRKMAYHLSPFNILAFQYSHSKQTQFGGNSTYVTIPSVMVTKPSNTVVLATTKQAITLRRPMFGDTEGGLSKIVEQRTITGRVFTYARRNIGRKLKYTFEIPKVKALELRMYIRNYLSTPQWLHNWKGEIWYGVITNNPFSFKGKSRWGKKDGESVEVEIEFEGVQLH